MENKDKFLKVLEKKLSPSQKKLFRMVTVEDNRKDCLVFRMPVGFISLEGVWKVVEEVSAETKIKATKAEMFATLDELDDILGNIEWLWDGWVPKGFVTMLAGDPGVGKSAIAQHLCKIVTEGACFPLEKTPLGEERDVIWIDTESAQQILKVRGDTMKINKKRVYLPAIHGDIMAKMNLGSEADKQNIINLIEGVNPALLVLDSLGSAHSRGENKVEEMRPVMEFLATTARDYQIAVLVIHHLNKERKDESPEIALNRLRGSTVIPANCRSIMAIERSVNKTLRISMIKSNLAMIADPITAIPLLDSNKQFIGFNYEPYIAPPSKKNRKEQCADWVMETLQSNKGEMAFSDLLRKAEAAGHTRSTVYASRDILGDRVMYGGTGNKSIWSLVKQDKELVKNIMNNGRGKHA